VRKIRTPQEEFGEFNLSATAKGVSKAAWTTHAHAGNPLLFPVERVTVERDDRERADMVRPAITVARPTPVIIDKNHHALESSRSVTSGKIAISVATSPRIVRIAPARITRCARTTFALSEVSGIGLA